MTGDEWASELDEHRATKRAEQEKINQQVAEFLAKGNKIKKKGKKSWAQIKQDVQHGVKFNGRNTSSKWVDDSCKF